MVLATDLTALPPLLIRAGTGDFALEDAKRPAERARAHRVEAHLELYPVSTLAFQVFWSFRPEAGDAIAQAGRFARDTLTANAHPTSRAATPTGNTGTDPAGWIFRQYVTSQTLFRTTRSCPAPWLLGTSTGADDVSPPTYLQLGRNQD